MVIDLLRIVVTIVVLLYSLQLIHEILILLYVLVILSVRVIQSTA